MAETMRQRRATRIFASGQFQWNLFQVWQEGTQSKFVPRENKSENSGSNKQDQGSKKKDRGSVIRVAKLVILHPIVGKMRRTQARGSQMKVSEQERKLDDICSGEHG